MADAPIYALNNRLFGTIGAKSHGRNRKRRFDSRRSDSLYPQPAQPQDAR